MFKHFAFGVLLVLSAVISSIASELPRRGTLGIALAPSADGNGMRVIQITNPNPSGLQVEDVVLSINGKYLTGPKGVGVTGAVFGIKAQDRVELEILRKQNPLKLQITATAAPPPMFRGAPVELGHATAPDKTRVRTFYVQATTRKFERGGRFPAAMILPGIPCGTVEAFSSPAHPYTKFFDKLTSAGITVVMAEKPGQGDSEGEACHTGGFDAEEQAFRAAAAAFIKDKRIDPKRFFIIGLSLGAVQAPLVSETAPAAAIVTWGGAVGPWYEYLLAQYHRRAIWQGESGDSIAAYERHWRRVTSAMFIENMTPAELQARYPESFAAVAGSEGSNLSNLAGRSWKFHREIDRAATIRAWNAFKGRLLSLHGEYDWVSEMHDHRLAADIVNRNNKGAATFEIVPGNDHLNSKHKAFADSFVQLGQGEPDDTFYHRVTAFLTAEAGR